MHIPEDGYLLRIFVGESDKRPSHALRINRRDDQGWASNPRKGKSHSIQGMRHLI